MILDCSDRILDLFLEFSVKFCDFLIKFFLLCAQRGMYF